MTAATNPMIAAAIERGEDTTGHCTLRGLVELLRDHEREVMGLNPCELAWIDEQCCQVNVEVKLTRQGDWRYPSDPT